MDCLGSATSWLDCRRVILCVFHGNSWPLTLSLSDQIVQYYTCKGYSQLAFAHGDTNSQLWLGKMRRPHGCGLIGYLVRVAYEVSDRNSTYVTMASVLLCLGNFVRDCQVYKSGVAFQLEQTEL